jgi:hypothetical protein
MQYKEFDFEKILAVGIKQGSGFFALLLILLIAKDCADWQQRRKLIVI